ncbi:hypothetical protein HF086_000611 [Spodoptera exigua]|uniref:Uncharacterized protein n=1 Tax=Spodoptera exigua TaxID=7107 RepID=A0A922SEW0_SPOEX|nr:hypothetical protein HF086_000611 [Spodoptera exigua]
MFTNILYRYCCVNIFFFFIFINIEWSLLSRVKSPVEHLPEATPDYVLPKNIYRYEPYRGNEIIVSLPLEVDKYNCHKTLWAPTHTSGPTTQDSRTLLRTRPPINKPQNYKETPRQETSTTTKRHFWHHFDDAAEEWPKVILITTSTPRLTSKVTRKKTFSTYFPQLRLLPIDENETEIKDADNDDDQNYVIGSDKSTMKDKEKSMPDNEVEEMAEDYDDIQLSSVTKGANTRTYAYLRNSSVETTKLLQTTIRETTTLATTTQPEPTELKNEEKIEQNTQSGTQSEELEPRNENLPNGKNRKCYQCGLNLTGIPHEPTCHQIFDTTKRRYQYLKSQLKVVCTGPVWRRRSNRIKRAPSYDVSPRKLYKGYCCYLMN